MLGDYDMDGMWRMETTQEEWEWRVRPMSRWLSRALEEKSKKKGMKRGNNRLL